MDALEKTSGHWAHFRTQGPGAGFDVDYGRTRRPLKSEIAVRLRDAWAALRGDTANRHAVVFATLWPRGPVTAVDVRAVGGSPVAYLAANYANTILTYTEQRERPLFLEIGAGSGYLTYFILQAMPESTACVIDLAETLAYCRENLHRFGVADRVQFITADKATLEAPKFDIAANTASMQEMLPETIEAYFGLLRRNANPGAVFYCCNRVEKWLSTKPGSSDSPEAKADIPVRFADYPWGDERDVLFRVSQMHRRLGMEPCQERMILFN